MKITFINPPWLFKLPFIDRLSNVLGLLYLATEARRQGHLVQILDALRADPRQSEEVVYNGQKYFRFGLSYLEIISKIPEDTDCVAISAPFTNLFHVVEEFTRILRERRPKTLIILGGGLPSAAPDLCATIPNIDLILLGEGDISFMELLRNFRKTSLKDGPILVQGEIVKDLDTLAIPDRSLVYGKDLLHSGARNRTKLPTASIVTSRGCPYNCHFCSIHQTMSHIWRGRSSRLVIEEIKMLIDLYGVQIIEFEDDNLLHDINRAFDIFNSLAKLRHDNPSLLLSSFPNGIRIDKLSMELLQLMKQAGARKIVLPVEHGNIVIREKMGKPLTNDQIFQACTWASDCGISTDVFVMIGYPDETEEIFESGLAFLKELGALPNISINYLFPQPYPGTQLRTECILKKYKIDAPDKTLFCGIGPVITTPLFDRKELTRRRHKFEIQRMLIQSHSIQSISPLNDLGDIDNIILPDTSRMVLKQKEISYSITGSHNGSFFRNCKFSSESLKDCTMMYSEFYDCDFSECDFTGFDASYSIFVNCLFTNSILKEAKLCECKLQHSDFSGLNMTRIDLSGSDLSGIDFSNANLTDANLSKTKLIKIQCSKTLFKGTIISNSIVRSVNMDNMVFESTIIRDSLFKDVSLRRISAINVSMQRSNFIMCDLSFGKLSGYFQAATFLETNLNETTFDKYPEREYLEVWDGTGCHYVRKDLN